MKRILATVGFLLTSLPALAQPVPPPAKPPLMAAQVPRSGVIPALHLSPVASNNKCIIGDSTSTTSAARLVPNDLLWGNLQRGIVEQNPGATPVFQNFAIGGTAWNNFLGNAVTSPPPWYFTAALNWNLYVQAAACDDLYVNWGVNDADGLIASNVIAVLANVVSWGVAPPAWTANTAYAKNAVVLDSNGRMEAAASAGTSGGAAPTWLTAVQAQVLDNGVVWRLMQAAPYVAKVPHVVLITNKTANAAGGAPFNTAAKQNGYLAAAAWQRTLAQSGYNLGIAGLPPLGLIDVGRVFNEAVYGFDPAEQYFVQSITAPINGIALPYSLPPTASDLDVTFTFDGTGMQAAATTITMALGNSAGVGGAINQLNILSPNGTDLRLNYYPGPATTPVSVTAFGGFNGTGANLVEVIAQGGHIQIFGNGGSNGVPVFDRYLPRYASPSTPVLTVTNPPAGFVVNVQSYNVSVPRPYAPMISVAQCYGPLTGASPSGGNGINHNASPCINLVDRRVIDSTRLSVSDP